MKKGSRILIQALASLVLFLGVLLPSPLFAQEHKEDTGGEVLQNVLIYPLRLMFKPATACIKSTQCAAAQNCEVGICKTDPVAMRRLQEKNEREREARERMASNPNLSPARPGAWENSTAVSDCGADRRCRIDRLKRRNQARRYQSMLLEEDQARRTQERLATKKAEENIRLNKPLTAEFYVTRMGPGVAVGYTLASRFHLDASITRRDSYIYDSVTVDGSQVYIEGSYNSVNIAAQATYYLRTGMFAPYFSGGVFYGRGGLSPYYYDDFGFGDSSGSDSTVILHVVQGSLGLDAQSRLGARARLGFMLRQPIYTQARYSPGNYDTSTKSLVEGWFKENQRFGVEFSLGWAF